MRETMKKLLQLTIATTCLLACAALSAITIPGADGSDGALHVTEADCVNGVYVINLARAATKAWDAKPEIAGNGVYDPDKWAVVFKYSSVTIDEGCTVRFTNHPANPPVYWLVKGDVTINGILCLDGGRGQDYYDTGMAKCATPGPGGFAGGLGMTYDSVNGVFTYGGGGYGPGGAVASYYSSGASGYGSTYGGSYANFGLQNDTEYYRSASLGHLYGNETLMPLLGGSGGSGVNYSYNAMGRTGGGAGGAGGGAICIAASGKVTLAGAIYARGGRGGIGKPSYSHVENKSRVQNGKTINYTVEYYNLRYYGAGGSGGAVRILADSLEGNGIVDVSCDKDISTWRFLEKLAQSTERDEVAINSIYDQVLGASGRVRLDVNNILMPVGYSSGGEWEHFYNWEVKPSIGNSDKAVLWAEARIIPLTLGGVSLPTDPRYRDDDCNECISFSEAADRELVFRTENIPLDANVVVKVTPRKSAPSYTGTTVSATVDAGGTYASATWRAMIPLYDAHTTFQVLVSTSALYE